MAHELARHRCFPCSSPPPTLSLLFSPGTPLNLPPSISSRSSSFILSPPLPLLPIPANRNPPNAGSGPSSSDQEPSQQIPPVNPPVDEEDEEKTSASPQEYSSQMSETSSGQRFGFFRFPQRWFGRDGGGGGGGGDDDEEETEKKKKKKKEKKEKKEKERKQGNREEFDGILAFDGGDFQIEWRDIVDPTPENVLALLLTGLLGLAVLQIFWQLLLVAITITLAGLKYSVIAAILLALLIVFL